MANMPGNGAESRSRSVVARLARALHEPELPIALGVGALLLFCWPFVRSPPLSIAEAFAHLFGAWLLTIAALALFARALARPAGEDRDG
jgi:hypothetical protein